jgi:hypothetical protein
MRNITFVQNSCFQVNGRITVPIERKPSILEAGVPGTPFPYENRVTLGKE